MSRILQDLHVSKALRYIHLFVNSVHVRTFRRKGANDNDAHAVPQKKIDIVKAVDTLESTVMSPYVAQEQYKSGKLPDIVSPNPCFLKKNANGKLLDNIHIEQPIPTRPGNRLFCGTYTYEKNHATNVRIMKQTWTKKCDGWLAFSTVDDATIPCKYTLLSYFPKILIPITIYYVML